jgi:hypothetical protein
MAEPNPIGHATHLRLISRIHCPICGAEHEETMPLDACVIAYACSVCQTVLHPLPGDCCVFCSYGDVPCPPIQMEIGMDA